MATDPQFQLLQDLGMFTENSCMCGWPAGHHDICWECRQCMLLCQDMCERKRNTVARNHWQIPCDCGNCPTDPRQR